MSKAAKLSPVAEAAVEAATPAPVAPVRLDLGCGKNKREGFFGVDSLHFEGVVDQVVNLAARDADGNFVPWPWDRESVDEAHCSHFIEHLTWPERIHFFNELYRVLKVGAKCQVILPHWASARYYGDPTHKEPMSEWAFFYLNKEWRDVNAPHAGYTCDFDWTYGYNMHPALVSRNQEYQQHALTFWKEAAQDIIATVAKRP